MQRPNKYQIALVMCSLTLLLSCSLIIVAGCSREESPPLGSAPAVVFSSDRVIHEEPMFESMKIYIMNLDGTEIVRLTKSIGSEQHPACSPDGKKIAYDFKTFEKGTKTGIYVIDANGENMVRLTDKLTQNHHPSWSPDGKRIVLNLIAMGMRRYT